MSCLESKVALAMSAGDGVKAGTKYSVIPASGAGDFDVVRDGINQGIGKDLKLFNVLNHVPQIDWVDGVQVLKTQKAGNALIAKNISFDDAVWSLVNGTLTAGQSSPHVTYTTSAYTFTATSANAVLELVSALTIANTTAHTNSIYVKRITGTGTVYIKDINNAETAITTTSEWTRFDVTSTSSSTSGQAGIKLATSGDAVDIFLVQSEVESFATSPMLNITDGEIDETSLASRIGDVITLATTPSGALSILWNDYVQNYVNSPTTTHFENSTKRYSLFNRVLTASEITGLGATEAAFISAYSGTDALSITVSGEGTCYWGDGESDVYTGTDDVLTHTFSAIHEPISFVGTLTKIYMATTSSKLNHDLASLPSGLTTYDNIGSNTTSGDIASLPSGLTYYSNTGSNTTSGDIASLPSGLTTYVNAGLNTTSGDMASLPIGLTYYYNTGSNQVNQYTSGHTFSASMTFFLNRPAAGYGLDSTEVDNLLIDLESSGMSSGTINIAGNNAARTAASDAAVTSLEGKGVTVDTN